MGARGSTEAAIHDSKHVSPPCLNTVQAPLVTFGGLENALAAISARKTGPIFADTMDFFGVAK